MAMKAFSCIENVFGITSQVGIGDKGGGVARRAGKPWPRQSCGGGQGDREVTESARPSRAAQGPWNPGISQVGRIPMDHQAQLLALQGTNPRVTPGLALGAFGPTQRSRLGQSLSQAGSIEAKFSLNWEFWRLLGKSSSGSSSCCLLLKPRGRMEPSWLHKSSPVSQKRPSGDSETAPAERTHSSNPFPKGRVWRKPRLRLPIAPAFVFPNRNATNCASKSGNRSPNLSWMKQKHPVRKLSIVTS